MSIYCTYDKGGKQHRWPLAARDGDPCACGSKLLNDIHEAEREATRKAMRDARGARRSKRDERFKREAQRHLAREDERALHPPTPVQPPADGGGALRWRWKGRYRTPYTPYTARATAPAPTTIPEPELDSDASVGDFLARYSPAERAVILGGFEPDDGIDYYFSCDGNLPRSIAYRNRRGEFMVAGRWPHHHVPA